MRIHRFGTHRMGAVLERYKLPMPEGSESNDRLKKLGRETVMHGLDSMEDWFSGRMMSSRKEAPEVVKTFKKIGDLYNEEKIGPHLYRAVHIHLPEENMTNDEIMKTEKAVTGPKSLQSWSTTKKAAEYFFSYFVKEQNRHDFTDPDTAWIIVKSKPDDLETLITFEACLRFMADVFMAGPGLGERLHAKMLVDSFYDPIMLDLHEYICDAPGNVPVKVESILVPPAKEYRKERHKNAA